MAKTNGNGSRREVEKDINDTFGFVPEFYDALPDAGFSHAWAMHKTYDLGETVLDNKTKELIGLAVASHIKCRYCIYFHTKAAELHGASEQEMKEAILMGGMTVMFSNNITGTNTDLERFQKEVDRAITHLSKQNGGSAKKSSPQPRAR